jgi:hypothetical protein
MEKVGGHELFPDIGMGSILDLPAAFSRDQIVNVDGFP